MAGTCGYTCDAPKYQSYCSYLNFVGSLGPGFPYGSFCTNCKKPYVYNKYKKDWLKV